MKRIGNNREHDVYKNWVCTTDPSGDFLGGKFPLVEIVMTAQLGYFAVGTVFISHSGDEKISIHKNRTYIRKVCNATKNNF